MASDPKKLEEIKQAVLRTGRPLEVECAKAFLDANAQFNSDKWQVHNSSYFIDAVSNKPRELDVLARKRFTNTANPNSPVSWELTALVSCKAFYDEELVTFSLTQKVTDVKDIRRPQLPCNPIEAPGRIGAGVRGAERLLNVLGIGSLAPSIIGAGIYNAKNSGKKAQAMKLAGDSEHYEGVDSALKAAFYWRELKSHPPEEANGLSVPILVTRNAWINASLNPEDAGACADCDLGYMANLYPATLDRRSPPEPFLVLLAAQKRLPDVMTALETVFLDLRKIFTP